MRTKRMSTDYSGNAVDKRQHIFAGPLDDIAHGIARSKHRHSASAKAARDDGAALVVTLPSCVGVAAASRDGLVVSGVNVVVSAVPVSGGTNIPNVLFVFQSSQGG